MLHENKYNCTLYTHVASVGNTGVTLSQEGVSEFKSGCDITVHNVTGSMDEAQFQALLADLTISVNSTSRHRRRYRSWYENRPYAKSAGYVGVIVITFVCVVPLLSDVVGAYKRYVMKRQRQREKRNRMERLRRNVVEPINTDKAEMSYVKEVDNTTQPQERMRNVRQPICSEM